MKKIIQVFGIRDLLITVGIGSLFYGVFRIHPPSAFIVGGLVCIYLGWPKGGEK